eukprot:1138627-Pelagomonas_calceolata.AAC.9
MPCLGLTKDETQSSSSSDIKLKLEVRSPCLLPLINLAQQAEVFIAAAVYTFRMDATPGLTRAAQNLQEIDPPGLTLPNASTSCQHPSLMSASIKADDTDPACAKLQLPPSRHAAQLACSPVGMHAAPTQ